MNRDLLVIQNWCFDNQLLLNPGNLNLLVFGSRQMFAKVTDFRFSLLGKELIPVKVAKDLGVILDSNLTYNEHIMSIVSSCMSRLGQIYRVKHVYDQRTLIIIILSYLVNFFTAAMFGATPLNVILINFKQSRTLHAESSVELGNTITLSRSSRA